MGILGRKPFPVSHWIIEYQLQGWDHSSQFNKSKIKLFNDNIDNVLLVNSVRFWPNLIPLRKDMYHWVDIDFKRSFEISRFLGQFRPTALEFPAGTFYWERT